MICFGLELVGSWIVRASVTGLVLHITRDLGKITQLSNGKNRDLSSICQPIKATRRMALKLIKLFDLSCLGGAVILV